MNEFTKEILEQPTALRNTLEYFKNGDGAEAINNFVNIWAEGCYNQLVFTGMGSSFFAPNAVMGMLNNSGILANNLNAGELLHYYYSHLTSETLLTCVSQSGESYEVVKLLENLDQNFNCIAVTNDAESTLARKATVPLLTLAGNEQMTSTKTFVSTLLALHIQVAALVKKWNVKRADEINATIEEVEKVIESRSDWLPELMSFLGKPSFIQVIGRGPSFSSVQQTALMIMEATRKPASAMLGGEFRHGPMEMVKRGFRAILFAPMGSTFEQGVKMARDIAGFGGKVLILTNSKLKLKEKNILSIHVGGSNEYLFPVPAIVPAQFAVSEWAKESGKEPGSFVRGAKVTRVE